VQVGLSM